MQYSLAIVISLAPGIKHLCLAGARLVPAWNWDLIRFSMLSEGELWMSVDWDNFVNTSVPK